MFEHPVWIFFVCVFKLLAAFWILSLMLSEYLNWRRFRLEEAETVDLNHADDKALSVLSGNVKIRNLYLRYAKVTDAGMQVLADCRSLEYINMHFTDIGTESQKVISRLPKLQELHQGPAPGINDEGLLFLGQCQTLESLHLDSTSITDAGIAHLSGLSRLWDLHIMNTSVSDAAIPALSLLKSLRVLMAQGSKISERGAAELQKALPGLEVYL